MTTELTDCKLPDTLHELLALALADLEKVEAMPETYIVEMSEYHKPSFTGRCFVCLAGAVLAQTCKADPRTDAMTLIRAFTRHKLFAINALRVVDVIEAWTELKPYVPVPDPLAQIAKTFRTNNWPDYALDRKGFKAKMWELHDALKAANL